MYCVCCGRNVITFADGLCRDCWQETTGVNLDEEEDEKPPPFFLCILTIDKCARVCSTARAQAR